jgi:hypothetical protein
MSSEVGAVAKEQEGASGRRLDKCTKVRCGKFRSSGRGSHATLLFLEARKSPHEGRGRIVTPRAQSRTDGHRSEVYRSPDGRRYEVGVRSWEQGCCLGIEGEAAPESQSE